MKAQSSHPEREVCNILYASLHRCMSRNYPLELNSSCGAIFSSCLFALVSFTRPIWPVFTRPQIWGAKRGEKCSRVLRVLPDHPPPSHRLQGLPDVSLLHPRFVKCWLPCFRYFYGPPKPLTKDSSSSSASRSAGNPKTHPLYSRKISAPGKFSASFVHFPSSYFICWAWYAMARLQIFSSLFVWTDLTSLGIILLQAIQPPSKLKLCLIHLLDTNSEHLKKVNGGGPLGGSHCPFYNRPLLSFNFRPPI